MTTITWDLVNKGSSVTLSNSNLTATIPNHSNNVRATSGKIDGKWYWEIYTGSLNNNMNARIGIVNNKASMTSNLQSDSNTRSYASVDGRKYPSNASYGESYWFPFTISVALDIDNGTLEFYKNGISQGVAFNDIKSMGEIFPFVSGGNSAVGITATVNFGSTPFKYPIPNGFKAYEPPINKTLILCENKYKKYGNKAWTDLTYTSPTSTNFINDGFEVSDLNRSVQTLNPQEMTQDTTWAEGGKVFKKSIDLKKYFDIRSINITN